MCVDCKVLQVSKVGEKKKRTGHGEQLKVLAYWPFTTNLLSTQSCVWKLIGLEFFLLVMSSLKKILTRKRRAGQCVPPDEGLQSLSVCKTYAFIIDVGDSFTALCICGKFKLNSRWCFGSFQEAYGFGITQLRQ